MATTRRRYEPQFIRNPDVNREVQPMSDDPFREDEISNWRGITGELVEREIRALEHMEVHGASQDVILAKAREFASQRLLGDLFQAVPPPDGAIRWLAFQGVSDDEAAWLREFHYEDTDFDGLSIRVQGHQRSDGPVDSAELLASGYAQLTSEQCRQLAAALYAAAKKIDDLTATER
jgi:hypothetical protein